MRAIRIETHSGPEALTLVDLPDPEPGPGQALVRHEAIGVNFIDVYHRTGLYPLPTPTGLGTEAAGIVEAVGEGVSEVQPGDRVAYCTGPAGAYAEKHVVAAASLVRVPDAIPSEIAAASLLKGMTARYLVKRTYPLGPGKTALVYAAAGGVGQILTQWAVHLGATVIAVVSTDGKAELAKRLGAHHAIVTAREDIAGRARALTGGEGVDVAYDSVGKDTLGASLDSLAPMGLLASYGNASGPLPAIEPAELGRRGSLFLTRASLFHHVRTRALLDETASDLFDVIERGIVKIAPPTRYALSDAAQAHRDLESRKTTGSLVLVP